LALDPTVKSPLTLGDQETYVAQCVLKCVSWKLNLSNGLTKGHKCNSQITGDRHTDQTMKKAVAIGKIVNAVLKPNLPDDINNNNNK